MKNLIALIQAIGLAAVIGIVILLIPVITAVATVGIVIFTLYVICRIAMDENNEDDKPPS